MTRILTLQGSIEEELDYDPRRLFVEECGLAGVIGVKDSSLLTTQILANLRHRGEDGFGIATVNGEQHISLEKRKLTPDSVDTEELKKILPGKTSIGHSRYPTSGATKTSMNLQPLRAETKFGLMTLAHNGNLVNIAEIKKELISEGACFRSRIDSEVFTHLIARSKKEKLEDAIIETALKVGTAFSILIMTPNKTFALKDPFGNRPLFYSNYQDGFLIASEDFAFSSIPGHYNTQEIKNGEMVIFERGKNIPKKISYSDKSEMFCIFEGFYFADPSTTHNGVYHEDFRKEAGRELFRQNPTISSKVDFVVPILDSGKFAAQGFCQESQVPYEEVLKRNHHFGHNKRSFISQDPIEVLKRKFFLREDMVKNKKVLTIDDSLVRSNTMRHINRWLREAGAKEVHNGIAAPPITNICPNGIDMQDKDSLAAAYKKVSEIQEMIGADSLFFLDPNLRPLIKATYNCGMCTGCFGGQYPISPSEDYQRL